MVFIIEIHLILLQRWKPPHLLYWICESCLCLCPGTCLPSRSNRMFPVDVWPATTPVPRWWSPILFSVCSSWLFPHLAQETKESTDQITSCLWRHIFQTELVIKHCHIRSTLRTIANWLSVCCYGYLSVGCLNIILQDCFRTTSHIMAGNTEHFHNLTFLSHSLTVCYQKGPKTTCIMMEISETLCLYVQ